MIYQKGELPDQPEAKINVLEDYVTKQIQYRTKGRVLKYLTEFEFSEIVFLFCDHNPKDEAFHVWSSYTNNHILIFFAQLIL